VNEFEVIKRLKEHLKAKRIDKGFVTVKDLYWCITYIQDFLRYNKNKAAWFLEEKVLECSREDYLKKWGNHYARKKKSA
jgi:hypothetical protein